MNENKYLQDFFNKKYADSVGNSNFYIAFEDCGFHISKESFNDPITQQYSQNVQVEQLSNDCDYVVPVCDTVPGHSASTISGYVDLLKTTIHFNDDKFASNPADMLALFGNAKDQLAKQFVSMQSSMNPRDSFYPSNLNPSSFLDDGVTEVWTPYSESWSFPSTPAGTGGSGTPTGIWKIRPDLLKAIRQFKNFPTAADSDTPTRDVNIRRRMATTPQSSVATSRIAAAASPTATATTPTHVTMATTMAFKPADTTVASDAAGARPLPAHMLIDRNILAQRFVLANDPGKKDDQPVTTSSVDINFKYCIANIERPWLYKNILDINQTWYCTGLTEGFFSTGDSSPANTGKLPSLPVSMILIRDLFITAIFNAGDWENAKKAVALDSLNIAEADFKDLGNNKHIIESAGVQIIGWICEYLPKFPVCSDPNLPAS